jgi:hypothetical protein
VASSTVLSPVKSLKHSWLVNRTIDLGRGVVSESEGCTHSDVRVTSHPPLLCTRTVRACSRTLLRFYAHSTVIALLISEAC